MLKTKLSFEIQQNYKENLNNLKCKNYSNPIEPAVNPTMQKNENSRRSLGREFKIKFN